MIIVIYVIFYLLTLAYGALSYVGMSLGGSRMARKVGMSCPWMFWIPGANVYALGNLADTQASLCEGKTTKFRKKLLAWTIILTAATIIWAIVISVVTVAFAASGMLDASGSLITTLDGSGDVAIINYLLAWLISSILFLVPYVIYVVVYYKCLYRIYKLYAPDGAAGFVVLSILAIVAIPILFLVLSGKDPVLPVPPSMDGDTSADGDASSYAL